MYVSPTEPGLTFAELMEVGNRLGYQQGEIHDNLKYLRHELREVNARLLCPNSECFLLYRASEKPDYLDFDVLDQLHAAMSNLTRVHGQSMAQIGRTVLVERLVQAGADRKATEVAITVEILRGGLSETDGTLKPVHPYSGALLPGQDVRTIPVNRQHSPKREETYAHVGDVIARRSDGRPSQADPLSAFADTLSDLGFANFRMWWTQMILELSSSNPLLHPVSVLVLSAALVEGALTFIGKYARQNDLDAFKSKDYEREPKYWKLDDLLKSAAMGGHNAVLSERDKLLAERLVTNRQRIHAGRMLSDYPSGPVPDLRPEEALEAIQTAKMVVRSAIDWINLHPKTDKLNS